MMIKKTSGALLPRVYHTLHHNYIYKVMTEGINLRVALVFSLNPFDSTSPFKNIDVYLFGWDQQMKKILEL